MKRWACALVCLLGVACDKTSKVGADAPVRGPSDADAPSTLPVRPTIMQKVAMPPASETKQLATSSNTFGFDLYAKVRGTPGNVAMSPASISAALAMTFGGARGETEAQMKKVLHLEGDRDSVMSSWGTLTRALQSPDRKLELKIANRLFGEKSTAFDAGFIEKTKTAFGAPLEPLDFKNAFEPARGHINAWVETETRQRIKELLPPRSLDGLTRMVLVNAIYFLADWAEPFMKEATSDEAFKVSATSDKKTPMMRRSGQYRVTEADGVKVLELPYKGNDAAMLVILPNKVDGLAEVEASLTAAKLQAFSAALAEKNVFVTFPRFEVSPSTMALADQLKALGMPLPFERLKADFTGISNPPDPRERLNIDAVFHKAFVKVDEKGTEAAAATAVSMAAGGGPPPKPFEFRADHPFVYAIVDKPTGLVLFLGRVSDPTTK